MMRDVQIALYDMITSTTPESNKSQEQNGLMAGCRGEAQKSSIPTAMNIREPQGWRAGRPL
jgi:hypothetical protein